MYIEHMQKQSEGETFWGRLKTFCARFTAEISEIKRMFQLEMNKSSDTNFIINIYI